MGIVIRQSFWSSISAFVGVGIGYLNIIILMPKYLSQEEVGIVRTITSIATLLVPFILFGMNGALAKYYPNLKSKDKKGLVNFTFMIVGAIFVTLLGVGYLCLDFLKAIFEENAAALNTYFPEIVIMAGLISFFTLVTSYSKSNFNISTPNIIRELLQKTLHGLLIILVGIGAIKYSGYISGVVIIYGLIAFVLILFVRKKFGFSLGTNDIRSLTIKPEVITLASFTLLGGVGSAIVVQVDQIMVTKYIGLTSNSIYSTALFMALVINIPRKFVSQISIPIITNSFHRKDYKSIDEHYKKASVNHLLMGGFLLTVIATNLHSIYTIMPNGNLYDEGYYIVIVLGIAKLMDMTFSLNGEILYLSPYYKYTILFVVILAITTIISNMLMIPQFGAIGAAYATLLTYLIYNLARFIFIKVKLNFSPFTLHTVFIALVIATIFFVVSFIPSSGYPFVDIVIKGLMTSILYAAYLIFFKPSEEIFQLYVQIKNAIKSYLK
ncbi:MAG: lipopolysaccharide biosynthesis protein [Ekhidna sp.]